MPTLPRPSGSAAHRENRNAIDRQALIKLLTVEDDDLSPLLSKRPQDLTEQEIRTIAMRRLDLPAGEEKEHLFRIEEAFFNDKFGLDPIELDATGRLVQPRLKRQINSEPVAARARDGSDLNGSTTRLAGRVADIAEDEGVSKAVRFLQRGLNVFNHANTEARQTRRAVRPPNEQLSGPPGAMLSGNPLFHDLKDDGDPGPKTRAALRTFLAKLGPAKAEEAIALGRFDEALRGRSAGDIDALTKTAFGHLFRDLDEQRPNLKTEEGESLQMAVNDLGTEILGKHDFVPIVEDGQIGPKTKQAFAKVLDASGPGRMTDALGRNLGFFMFDAG